MKTVTAKIMPNAFKGRITSLLAALVLAFSCSRESVTDPTGGETHFLKRCEPNGALCGAELSCLCGACTLPCSERAGCRQFPAAQCVASNASQGCAEAAETSA